MLLPNFSALAPARLPSTGRETGFLETDWGPPSANKGTPKTRFCGHTRFMGREDNKASDVRRESSVSLTICQV